MSTPNNLEAIKPGMALPKGHVVPKDNKIDLMFKGTKMERYFKVHERGSNFTTEFRAGCTTFLTAAYIMAVNPNVLSVTGLNFEGLVFATAMSSGIATLVMALWANLPFGLWPGMGMNAYFAYTLVAFKGTNHEVKRVMFAVMVEGLIFMFLSLLDIRRYVIKYFPIHLMKATMAGIGMFLAFIGLQAGNGIDLVRANPAVLVDIVVFDSKYQARTFIGIFFYFLMALLLVLKVRGSIMICILLSAFSFWTLEAGGAKQFVYEPQCCLGNLKFEGDWYPAAGSSWLGPEQFVPQPICYGPAGVYEVDGKPSYKYEDGSYSVEKWSGSTVSGSYYNWTVSSEGGSQTYIPGQALAFKGNQDGRNSLGFKGDCMDACHEMFGGFNPACFGSVLVDAGCWTGMTYREMGDLDQDTLRATKCDPTSGEPCLTLGESIPPYTVVDGFGEGCIGGAGREPKTFEAPSQIASKPKAAKAGGIIAPYPGWFACNESMGEFPDYGGSCTAGDIDGGTIWAFETDGLTWENFGIPLLVLLYIDFLGTVGFLYAAADRLGVIDPKSPHTFEGCYGAFWADAIGTFIGGILGTSSVTTYGESMAGIAEGGRTGLTALWIALFNFLCMFFSPFISSIPTISTGPALVIVGVFMATGLKDIDWYDYMQAIPALATVLLMPVTYKIEVGICFGLFIWAFVKVCSLRACLHIPGCYPKLPPVLQRFISRQDLSAFERSLLEAETAKSGAADSSATMDGSNSSDHSSAASMDANDVETAKAEAVPIEISQAA